MAEKNCENCANEFCAFIPPNGKVYCDRWRSNAPAVNRWIPCSERFPEQSEEGQPPNVKCSDCVLVAARDWIGMAYYVTYGEESQWEFADAQNKPKIDWVEVTYWMPIPEPPESEVQE